MYRFFEQENALKSDSLYLNSENTHHILNVLRMREDELFEVVIDKKVYLGNFTKKEGESLVVNVKDIYEDTNESKIKIHLYQGLPKSDKLELIIQKCIELGVSEITPFTSSRTIVKWDVKKESKKIKRYEDIAEAAAKQSKRGYIPKINGVIDFGMLIEQIKDNVSILAYENRGNSLRNVLRDEASKNINIIIGPEGGFSEQEVESLAENGAKVVHLGNRILRTETAAIALVAMIQYEIGDVNEEI